MSKFRSQRRIASRRRLFHRPMPEVTDPADRMRVAALWPLDECLVSPGWEKYGRARVVWVRRHPAGRAFAVVAYALDLNGLGVRKVEAMSRTDLAGVYDLIEAWGEGPGLERRDPELAVKLIYTAVERGLLMGLPLDPDWSWTQPLLGNVTGDQCREIMPDCEAPMLVAGRGGGLFAVDRRLSPEVRADRFVQQRRWRTAYS